MSFLTIKRALFSVSDKSFLEDLARGFRGLGVEILATGGTAERLQRAGVEYRPIETFTGNPEAFDGRMKTLSFKLESAILYDRTNPKHVDEAAKLSIEPIDCVVCNFYPFAQALAKGAGFEQLIEEVDVGGPTMVRAAAKNFKSVLVLTDPEDYAAALLELRRLGGSVSFEFRKSMMLKAFERVLRYDQSIYEGFARKPLRYGENPHQPAVYVPDQKSGAISWDLLDGEGLELSYNNILDAQAAYGAVRDALSVCGTGHGVCCIVKHNNPCGLASSSTQAQAFERAWAGDPVSSFGGVVAFSSPLTIETARLLDQKFVEVILAPGFEDAAIEELRRKKKKLRILKILNFNENNEAIDTDTLLRTRVEGGVLIQHSDSGLKEEFKQSTKIQFPGALKSAARFAVIAGKWIKSNAITIVRAHADGGLQLVGMGSGQPNRIDALRRLALPKAKMVLEAGGNAEKANKILAEECVMASDAFFPFADTVEEAANGGLRFIVQPGGSIKDAEVVAAADRLGVAMAFTGRRHFRH